MPCCDLVFRSRVIVAEVSRPAVRKLRSRRQTFREILTSGRHTLAVEWASGRAVIVRKKFSAQVEFMFPEPPARRRTQRVHSAIHC
jgi:hypothetical protein